jgi:TolB-like protein/DNA-binding winged helix-turn-helix (wHTH) protein
VPDRPMASPQNHFRLLKFGPYRADLANRELTKFGIRIPLQIKPFQILELFLEQPNELITRQALQQKGWPSGSLVEFEQGLNKAVHKLRVALCDTAEAPKYIETVPRLGYRFIAKVEIEEQSASPAEGRLIPSTPRPGRFPFFTKGWVQGIAALLVILTVPLVSSRIRFASQTVNLNYVAVLPLEVRGNDAEFDLADGLTHDIINGLARVPDVTVISHASVFQYRGQPTDLRKVGSKLGVASVLTGRVKQAGTRVTLNVELIRTQDQALVWGQQYTGDIADCKALSQEVAGAVAEIIRSNPTVKNRQRLSDQDALDGGPTPHFYLPEKS